MTDTNESAPIEGQVLDQMPSTQQAGQRIAITTANPYLAMIDKFMDSGKPISELSELLALKKEWEADEARKAFHQAVANFKRNPPVVYKDKKNLQYDSQYTSIGNLVNTVNAAMAPHGLSADWDIDQADPKNIIVTCTLSHAQGHSKQVSMSGAPDTTGAKNTLQQTKSTITYLKLATFEAVTGVASQEGNMDDDGNGAGRGNSEEDMAKVADFEVAILEAADVVTLEKSGKDIATCGLPPKLRTRLRKAYGSRLTELRKSQP